MFTYVANLELVKLLEVASELLLRFTGCMKYILAYKVQQKTQNCQGENNLTVSATAEVRWISNDILVGSNSAQTGFMVNMFNLGHELCH